MPQTSQDAFETLFPGKQPVSVNDLRIRSNSLTKNNKQLRISLDNTLVAAESNFWPPPADGSRPGQRIPREPRVSVGDFDSCYSAPEVHGYKRAISHR